MNLNNLWILITINNQKFGQQSEEENELSLRTPIRRTKDYTNKNSLDSQEYLDRDKH